MMTERQTYLNLTLFIVLVGAIVSSSSGLETEEGQENLDQLIEEVTGAPEKPVFVYDCSGKYNETTNGQCYQHGYPEVCYWIEGASNYFSCAMICNGVEHQSLAEDKCKQYHECDGYLKSYCSLEPKHKPTVPDKESSTAEPNDQKPLDTANGPSTPAPKDRRAESLINDPGLYQQKVLSIGQKEGTDQKHGLQPWAIVVIAVASVVVIAVTAVLSKFGIQARRNSPEESPEAGIELGLLNGTESETGSTAEPTARPDAVPVVMYIVPNSSPDSASPTPLSPPPAALSPPPAQPVTTTSEQPAIDPTNMENVGNDSPQCTDTNDGEGGRAMTDSPKKRSSSF